MKQSTYKSEYIENTNIISFLRNVERGEEKRRISSSFSFRPEEFIFAVSMNCCLLLEQLSQLINRGEGKVRDGKTNCQMAAVTKMSTSLIVAVNE